MFSELLEVYRNGGNINEYIKANPNLLVKNGWNVIRIRENPLNKITKNDIQVPTNCSTKEVANLTLIQLENVLGKKINGSKKYIKKKELSKEKESAKAIKNYILKNKRNKNSKIK